MNMAEIYTAPPSEPMKNPAKREWVNYDTRRYTCGPANCRLAGATLFIILQTIGNARV